MSIRTTVEAIILGRNDDYEEGWTHRLYCCLDYNRKRYEEAGLDYRVAFVEWNPVPGRSLLSADLIAAFPFVRAVAVEREVHLAVAEPGSPTMMLNFAYNAGLRSSTADYCVITSGDILIGRETVAAMAEALRPDCLFRAERVNILNSLDFATVAPATIEAPETVVSVDNCSSPPYDQPPFTNACGDFLMLDRRTMAGIRGFDEGVRGARLHLDTRFARTAMAAGLDCRLLGRIFHITHSNSHTVRVLAPTYGYELGLPYCNPPNWGLGDHAWSRIGDRLWQVGLPRAEAAGSAPNPSGDDPRTRAMVARLADIARRNPPPAPIAGVPASRTAIALERLRVPGYWEGETRLVQDGAHLVTSPQQFAYSAFVALPADQTVPAPDEWCWTEIRLRVLRGHVAVALLHDSDVIVEDYVTAEQGERVVMLPDPHRGKAVLFRNGGPNGPSEAHIHAITIIRQPRSPHD